MRLFYQAFPICDALRHELSWTHYRSLSDHELERRLFPPLPTVPTEQRSLPTGGRGEILLKVA